MSLNLILTKIKKGCGCRFDVKLYQTPTDITLKAVQSSDPAGVYLQWIDSLSWNEDLKKVERDKIQALINNPDVELEWSLI